MKATKPPTKTWWTRYDSAGRIVGHTEATRAVVKAQRARYVADRFDEATHRIVNGAAVERPPASVRLEGGRLLGVPSAALVWVDGVRHATAPEIDVRGARTVRVQAWPERDFLWESPAAEAARRRAREYPEIGAQLDAAMKGLRAYRDGQPLPPETLEWIETCEAVKARHPKE